MKTKKKIKFVAVGSFLLTLSAGFLIDFNLEKHYKRGDFIPEANAYFEKEVTNPTGRIKADKYVTPSDNKYSSQKTRSMGSEFIGNIESVWDTYTGAGTKIAIIDDGFDVDHPEFTRSDNSSAILPESRHYYVHDNNTPYNYNDDYVAYEEYSSDSTCLSEDWEPTEYDNNDNPTEYGWATHGTATSTTAAAPMGNGGGVGIAPGADILALKIDFSFDAIDSAIYYAIEQGVDVINMSLGAYADYNFTDGFGDSHNTNSQYGAAGYAEIAGYLEDACKAAYNAGIIVVAAAGNEATWHKSYPACNYKVVGVGALGDYDNKGNADKLAEFSNYVSTSQTGEINVDILAPGYVYTAEQTYNKSSDKNSSAAPSQHGHTWNDTQGTSFSSPIVAGAACLWKEKNPTGTPDQFIQELQASADGIGYYEDKMVEVSGWYSSLTDVGPSNIKNGRLNVSRLLGTEAYVNISKTNLYLLKNNSEQIQIESHNGSITYKSNNTSVATVDSNGYVTGVGEGSTTITVTATVGTQKATANVNVTVQDIVEATSLSFTQDSIDIEVGGRYNAEPLVTLTPSNASRIFLFESENPSIATVDEDTGEITGIAEGTATINAVAMYGSGDDSLTVNVTKASTVSDTLTKATTGVSGTSYTAWSGKEGESGAVYAGNSAGNYDSIQLRSSNNTSGIVTTTSGGNISEITVSWNSNTASGRILDIYGKNTAYANASNLYTSEKGTLLGSINSDTQTTLKITGNYTYVGVRSSSGALYMDSITFTWNSGTTPVPPTPSKTLSSISVSGQQTEFTVGDDFAFGGTVTAHYSDSSSADVTSSSSFDGYDMTTEGEQTVTVSYTEGTTKTTSYQINVASSGSGEETEYSGTFNRSNVGTTWTLSNYEDKSSYLLVPQTGTTSTALISGIFDGKEITSDVVITLHVATYGSGTNPSASAFKIYNSSACTTQVTATQTGTLPSSPTFTDVIYTVSQANAATSFTDDLAILITKPGKQIRLESITVEFTYEASAPKVINSLVATYSGGSLYAGQSLDESKVSVTAKFTNSDKYSDVVLPASDYTISGFDSSSAGNKVVTVTYTGSLSTVVSPLTTSFNVTVLEDTISSVTATVSKSYHPGETISKSDITLTVTYASSRVEHPTDFTFANDGYQFTYADAASGGAATNKTFTNAITYGANSYSLTVVVSRNAHQSAAGATDTLDREITGRTGTSYGDWSDVQGTSGAVYAGNSAGDNDSIQLRSSNSNSGIVMTASAGKVKSVTVTWESHTQTSRVLNIYGKNTAYSAATDLYNSNKQGTLLGTIAYGTTTLEINGDYTYIGIRSSSGALYLTDIKITFAGSENATNVANYIMFEDTENQCVSKLDTAITYFESMSKEERTLFMTSEDYVIATARERLEAWLANQEKQINIVDGDYVISNNKASMSYFSEEDNGITIILVASSFLSISILGCLLVLKKRKHI